MDASTRLYARLAEIPQDPNDPETLSDLLVCAFGAFERYYLCWRTKGGEYRHDFHDLPPTLNDWLHPPDGSTRDFATLQVVFGRGEEYFASDKDGKLEFKELTEPRKPVVLDESVKADRQALRRSKTISIFRPLSEVSVRGDRERALHSESVAEAEESAKARTPSVSSLRTSRPPSLSFSISGSDTVSLHSVVESEDTVPGGGVPGPANVSEWALDSLGTDTEDIESPAPQKQEGKLWGCLSDATVKTKAAAVPISAAQNTKNSLLHTVYDARPAITTIPEGERMTAKIVMPLGGTSHPCTCGQDSKRRSSYADASMQTDPITPPPQTALRINTLVAAESWNSQAYTVVTTNNNKEVGMQTPPPPMMMFSDDAFGGNGSHQSLTGLGMMDYFKKPGYQLGDGLASQYSFYEEQAEQQVYYEYQDKFRPEALQ